MTVSRPPRPTDPQALDALYALPAPASAGRAHWLARLWVAWRAWCRVSVADEDHGSEAARRIRLHGVALTHARRLESLSVAERVAVLREIARLMDVEPWVRVVARPDRRMRSLEGEGR